MGVDTAEAKYKSIALDWINNKFNDFIEIYKKYYPKVSEKSAAACASRLLSNAKFQRAKEEVLKEINIDKEQMAKKALLILDNLSECSEKKSDRIAAALGICKYTIGEKVENTGHMTYTQEEANEYARIRQPLLSLTN